MGRKGVELTPRQMQRRFTVTFTIISTTPMIRGLIAFTERLCYEYRIVEDGRNG